MPAETLITERDGMFIVALRSCTSQILAEILDPAIPFVWIRRHTPKGYVEWWSTRAPLSERGVLHDVEVRSLEFDLQLSTARFLELLPEFADHGMLLFQMTRRVPDSLTLDGVADSAIERVLIQNGLHLRFYLPHAVEYAQIASPHRAVLEKALQSPTVRELAVGTA